MIERQFACEVIEKDGLEERLKSKVLGTALEGNPFDLPVLV